MMAHRYDIYSVVLLFVYKNHSSSYVTVYFRIYPDPLLYL